MLLIGTDDRGLYKWACSTCPYEFPIAKQMTTRVKLTRKDVDDIMGGEDAWKNVDKTAGELEVTHHIAGEIAIAEADRSSLQFPVRSATMRKPFSCSFKFGLLMSPVSCDYRQLL